MLDFVILRRFFVLLCFVLSATGCATVQKDAPPESNTSPKFIVEQDPWEGFNRKVYMFNDKVDRALIKPIAKGYKRVVPSPVRRSVGNFFRNLLEPTTVINDALQGKVLQMVSDTGRFLINSSVGILGLFDVATRLGMERHQEDFGQTLAVWGVVPGPYVVLPLLGPSNVRDGFGLIPYYFYTDPRLALDSLEAQAALVGLDVIDVRSQLLGASRVLQMQLDPYVFVRESFRQKRVDLIFDGNPPLEVPPN